MRKSLLERIHSSKWHRQKVTWLQIFFVRKGKLFSKIRKNHKFISKIYRLKVNKIVNIIFLIGKFKFKSQFVTFAFKDHSVSLEILRNRWLIHIELTNNMYFIISCMFWEDNCCADKINYFPWARVMIFVWSNYIPLGVYDFYLTALV
jgi:hypothetical protein